MPGFGSGRFRRLDRQRFLKVDRYIRGYNPCLISGPTFVTKQGNNTTMRTLTNAYQDCELMNEPGDLNHLRSAINRCIINNRAAFYCNGRRIK